MPKRQQKRTAPGWDALATWYDGWMGAEGSDHHRKWAIPAALDLLDLRPNERLLDVGAGQGVLAPYVAQTGAHYTGVEISPRLLELARKRHSKHGRFVQGDARRLTSIPDLTAKPFDAAVFLLSIQDMNPLEDVLRSASALLREGGRLVLLMTHPCFRVPRQSGWGHDTQRGLRFRRVDRYLNPLAIPMKQYSDANRQHSARNAPSGRNARSRTNTRSNAYTNSRPNARSDIESAERGVSISFHRPLNHYVNSLADCGLLVAAFREIAAENEGNGNANGNAKGNAIGDTSTPLEQRANAEIPLFLGIRALKIG
jgi:ubiquinone/menaquinone biosynthesis C-methylase UbiE